MGLPTQNSSQPKFLVQLSNLPGSLCMFQTCRKKLKKWELLWFPKTLGSQEKKAVVGWSNCAGQDRDTKVEVEVAVEVEVTSTSIIPLSQRKIFIRQKLLTFSTWRNYENMSKTWGHFQKNGLPRSSPSKILIKIESKILWPPRLYEPPKSLARPKADQKNNGVLTSQEVSTVKRK